MPRDAVERLLTALSPASRIEPGLLRDLRRLLELPAAVESLAWQQRALSSRSSVAATLRAGAVGEFRSAFEAWARVRQGLGKLLIGLVHSRLSW